MASLPQTLTRPQPARLRLAGWDFARRHALFLSIAGVGAVLRGLATVAYYPALIIYDSQGFLYIADNFRPDEVRPIGYSAFLALLPDNLSFMAATQHALGIAIGVLIYVLLCRLGVPRWGSALAAAPVLLDGYQLVLEEYILTEAFFELLIVGGCAVLLWRRRPGPAMAALAGLLFAATALTRANGLVVIGPALIAVLALNWSGGWRPRLLPAAAMLAAFAIPLAGYAVWFHHDHGKYAISGYGGRFLYARVTPFADCTRTAMPPREATLCPVPPPGQRANIAGSTVEWYMWASESPIWTIPIQERSEVGASFAKRVIRHQPGDYLRTVSHDFLRGFAVTRSTHKGELWIARWRFPLRYPYYMDDTPAIIRRHGGGKAHVDKGLARFLRNYQKGGFTPGPVLAVGLIAGLLAALGIGRARRSGLRTAAFLFAAMGVAVFGSTVLVNQFSWRYQLILVVLLPPAAALGLTALIRRPRQYTDATR
jgi:dolichyl-phosphate-mannose-protein mannosyltransferase